MKKREQGITFLGKETEFEGKLTFRGTMRLDGHFKGEISAGDNLIVGEEGMIEANLHAAHIVISGEVHGNILADQRVDIHPPGKVFGNIQAPAVVIDEGVIFEGKTRMYQAKDPDDKESETMESEEHAGEPFASLGTIYGIVTDQNTDRPIKNAEIKCEGLSKKITLTNASGYYELINLQEGHWKMMIKAKGYKKGKFKIEISAKGTYEENHALEPKQKRPPA
jgi:cytoskeletal protein CcmA (bactofilin family)